VIRTVLVAALFAGRHWNVTTPLAPVVADRDAPVPIEGWTQAKPPGLVDTVAVNRQPSSGT
jgi:hypothetical protein